MNLYPGVNRVVFLLVQEDMTSPVGDIPTGDIRVQMSFNGGPWEVLSQEPTAMGNGWFMVDITVPTGMTPGPAVLLAKYGTSPEWRDIYAVQAIPDPSTDLADSIAGLQASMNILTQTVTQSMVEVADALEQIRIAVGKSFPSLSDIRLVHVGDLPATGSDILSAPGIVTAPAYVTRGTLRTAVGLGNLLLPGEYLGEELVPPQWGRYDSANASVVIEETQDRIVIRYDQGGGNQQVWKVISGLTPGDYALSFRLETLGGSGEADVAIRQHKAPYTTIGFMERVPDQTLVHQRVHLTPTDPANPTRVQFMVGGLYIAPETFKISEVSLKGIKKT